MTAYKTTFPRRLGALLLALAAAVAPLAPGHAQNVTASRPRATPEAAAARLAERIDAVLARPQARQARWGIEVRDAGTGRVLYARDAARPFVPASNLKLGAAAAAAHHLDPEFRFRTTLYAAGDIRDGVLDGDLVLYGRGDPMISARYFPSQTAVWEMLADSLRARGIRRVTGGVTADESFWDTERHVADWDPEDRKWWYAAPVGALGFNDNSIDFRILPASTVGQPARITGEPASAFYRLDNDSRMAAAGTAATLDFDRVPGTHRIRAFGVLPLGAGPDVESFAVENPARWAGVTFRETLEGRGIALGRAEVRVVSDSTLSVSRTAPVLAEWLSPPLDRAIGPVLLTSQNWFAEALVKTLGKQVRGEGSWAAGLAVERAFLVGVVGIDSAAFVLRDGSGLSALNRITPHALVNLLDYV
ncbi:MAG TPA: D-alanyl-D-alanine carboxypeptidase/D-alanyl-D-alanine-endopeptidase, partial [Longimicrobium sp.]|nr:D-alanyl-D-alanine carboxypeptidase/D-alanyl-D-alanine-endopeptidase [Longimicrobium sp.]